MQYQKVPQPILKRQISLIEDVILFIGGQQRPDHIMPFYCAVTAGGEVLIVFKAEKDPFQPEPFQIQIGPGFRRQHNAALFAEGFECAVFLHIVRLARFQCGAEERRQFLRREIGFVQFKQLRLRKIRADFLLVGRRDRTVEVHADEPFREHLFIQKIQDFADLAVLGNVGIEPEILLIFLQQLNEICLKKHPGLGHVPIQLFGGVVNHLFPIGGIAAVEEISEGLDDIHHLPDKGSGDGVGPAIVVVKGFGNIADSRITGDKGGNQRNILEQHFLIPIFLPDGSVKQLVDAVGDVAAVGDVIRQIDLPVGIGGYHRGPILLHIDEANVAHHHVIGTLLGFLKHLGVHFRFHRVVGIHKGDVFSPGGPGSGVAGHAQPLVFLMNNPDQLRVCLGVAVADFRGGILAAVVHQNDLFFLQGLGQNRARSR